MELVDSIHAQNAPTHRAEMRDESAKSKGKPPNCTTFVDQVVPGLLTTASLQKKLENLDGDIFTARQQVVAVKTK